MLVPGVQHSDLIFLYITDWSSQEVSLLFHTVQRYYVIIDLYSLHYDYTVKVTNRFKRLDLIDRMPEELWMEVCNTVQEAVIKTIPKKKREEKQRQRRKGKVDPSECRIPQNSKER